MDHINVQEENDRGEAEMLRLGNFLLRDSSGTL